MTALEAQIIGRAKTLKLTGIAVAVLLVIFLFLQTNGDFANGILFFMQALINIHVLVILAILFGLTYILGARAGKEVIIDKKNYLWTGIKYSVAIILAIIIYASIVGIYKDGNVSASSFSRLLNTYFLIPLMKTGSLAIIPMLIIWLLATSHMRTATTSNQSNYR